MEQTLAVFIRLILGILTILVIDGCCSSILNNCSWKCLPAESYKLPSISLNWDGKFTYNIDPSIKYYRMGDFDTICFMDIRISSRKRDSIMLYLIKENICFSQGKQQICSKYVAPEYYLDNRINHSKYIIEFEPDIRPIYDSVYFKDVLAIKNGDTLRTSFTIFTGDVKAVSPKK